MMFCARPGRCEIDASLVEGSLPSPAEAGFGAAEVLS
jgi:hypothetical protein